MPKEDFIHGQSKVEDFWKFINARHTIYLKRKDGRIRPWSDDPIFQEWKFTNVFRELDRGTIALRRMLRTLQDQHKQYEIVSEDIGRNLNKYKQWVEKRGERRENYIRNQFITCILYRVFNWHENAKFGPIDNPTAWYKYLKNKKDNGDQIFTGAYMQPSVKGEDKLVTFERVCRQIVLHADNIIHRISTAETIQDECWGLKSNTLEGAWHILKQYKHIGPFTAYEFVCDLRYTDILMNATDTHTWCNIGPGAERGLQRMGWPLTLESITQLWWDTVDHFSFIENHWMDEHLDEKKYPYWELREIEHCLREFDKYERVRLGQGRPRAKFNGMPMEEE